MNETWDCSFFNPVSIGSSTAFASSSCSVAPSSSVLAASGFTYGEVVISTLLFLLVVATTFSFIFNWAHGIKIAKRS